MPIRYIAAIILAVAVVGLAFTGIESVATTNSQQQMDRELAQLEQTAVSLFEHEELPPPGLEGSQRHMHIELPGDTLTERPIEYVEIRQVAGNNSMAEFQLEGGATHQRFLEVPITSGNNESIRLTGTGAVYELVLTLNRNTDGDRVVDIRLATDRYELLAESGDGGSVEIEPPGQTVDQWRDNYATGTELQLTAVPQENYTFSGWDRDSTRATSEESIRVTMDRDRNVTALFEPESDDE